MTLYLKKNFKGIDEFYNNIDSYNKLIDKYIDVLNKAKSNPEILIGLYQSDKHPFTKEMDEFLKSIKAAPELDKLLSQPAIASEQVTTELLKQYVQN